MNYNCSVIRSNRKTLSLQIERNGSIIIRAPFSLSDRQIEKFLIEKSRWIKKKIEKISEQNKKAQDFSRLIETDKKAAYKRKARQVLTERVEYYSKKYRFQYKKIRLSSARYRWGSCSAQNNLNFNWKIIFAPEKVIDYLVVHELVHTKHKNHKKIFWNTVEDIQPDFRESRKWLKKNSFLLEV